MSKYATKKGDRWYYVFSALPHPDGRPRRIKRGGFATRRTATTAMRRDLADRRASGYAEPSPMPLADHLDAWLAEVAPTVAPSTHHNYRDVVAHLKGELGAVPLCRLDEHAVQRAYAALSNRLAPSTLRITHNVLRSALAQAVRRRLIPFNAAEHARLPKLRHDETPVWSRDEGQRYLAATRDDPDHALWRLLLSTGMRVGEALALAWSAVDLDVGRVAMLRTLSRDADERRVIVERTKTKAGRRTLDLNAEAVAALRQYRVRTIERRIAARRWDDCGLVFPGRYGGIRSTEAVRVCLARACARA